MFFEQEKWQHTWNTLSTCTNCQFSLFIVVKVTGGISIALEIKYRGLQETIKTDKGGVNFANDQLGRITYGGLWPADLKADAHAVLFLEALNGVHLRDGADSNFVGEFFSWLLNFFKVDAGELLFKLLVELFIQ